MIAMLRSPFLLVWHGKRLHLLEGEVAQAEALYRRALVHNSLYIPAWLGLAELRNEPGEKAERRRSSIMSMGSAPGSTAGAGTRRC